MALIQWNEELSVKVVEIDRQHQKLIRMMNDLYSAMRQGKGTDVLGRILDELVDYSKEHFGTEEKYFERFGYPEASQHKKEHANFVRKVEQFKNDFQAGKVCLSVEVMTFLSNWLQNHIRQSDKRYQPVFHENGLR